MRIVLLFRDEDVEEDEVDVPEEVVVALVATDEDDSVLSNFTKTGLQIVGGSLVGFTPHCPFRLHPNEKSIPASVSAIECQYPAATLATGDPTT